MKTALPFSRATPFPPKATSSILRSTVRISNCSRRPLGDATLRRLPLQRCRGYHPVDRRFEIFHFHRFDEMLGKSGFHAFRDVAVHSESADRNSGNSRNRAKISHQLCPSAVGQRDVADEQVKWA